jgi:hypothetical protein
MLDPLICITAVYMGFLNYNIIFDIDISNYERDYTKIRDDFDHVEQNSWRFWSRGVVHEFSKMAVSLKWILDYNVRPLDLYNHLDTGH